MGQTLTRDLGLSASEEEEYKIAMAQQIVQEAIKKQQREAEGLDGLEKSNAEGESGLGESELEEECIDEDEDEEGGDGDVIGEDDEDMSAEVSFHKKAMKELDFEKKQHHQAEDDQMNGQNIYETKQKNANQFKRPFESIKVNDYFGQSDDDNDENEMLGDMSDEQEEYEQSDKEGEGDHPQQQFKSKKRTHNIREDADPQLLNGSNQKPEFEDDSSQIKFHHAFESPPSESEESSQFGPVFTDSDVAEEDDQDIQRQPTMKNNSSVKVIADKQGLKQGGQGGLRKEESLSQKGIDSKQGVGNNQRNKKDGTSLTPSQKDVQSIKSTNNNNNTNNRLSEGRLSNQGSTANINNNLMISSIEKRNNQLGIPVPNRSSSSKKSLSRDGSLQLQGNVQDQYAKYRASYFPDQFEKK